MKTVWPGKMQAAIIFQPLCFRWNFNNRLTDKGFSIILLLEFDTEVCGLSPKFVIADWFALQMIQPSFPTLPY